MQVVSDAEPSARPQRETRLVEDWLSSKTLHYLAIHFVRVYGLPIEEADDLVQELSIAVLLQGLRSPVGFPLLYRIAQRKAVDAVRARTRRVRNTNASLDTGTRAQPDIELSCLGRIEMARLPTRALSFCRLRFEEGCDLSEIGRRLGLPRGAVRRLEVECPKLLSGERRAYAPKRKIASYPPK